MKKTCRNSSSDDSLRDRRRKPCAWGSPWTVQLRLLLTLAFLLATAAQVLSQELLATDCVTSSCDVLFPAAAWNGIPTSQDSFPALDFDEEDDFTALTEDLATSSVQASDLYPSLLIRGQSSNTSYWNTVYNPYATTYVAQADPASTAPTLTGSGTVTGTPYVPPAPSTAPPVYGDGSGIALNPSTGTSTGSGSFTEPVQQVMKFWHNLSAETLYIPRGSKESGLGMNEFNLFTEFSFPCGLLKSMKSNSGFWYVAPGFSLNLWSGPLGWPHNISDMPPQTFDANLAFGVRPQITDEFSMEAWVQVGLAASFKKVNKHAIYVRGRAAGVLNITDDGRFQATGGVIYLCRNRYKLLPVAGVIWKPNERNVWRLVFPDPRLSRYLGKLNETDWWGYVQGKIGGGRWLIKDSDGDVFNTDYNDYRVGLGLSFNTPKSLTGNIEFGGAFGRELYAFGTAWYKPKSSIYLKGGLNY
ncbi:MAG: hypothetical protein Q4G68_03300 [Planctomycetia bacterium]|nr:hypothetical protein [Planctomycetia bacterium]